MGSDNVLSFPNQPALRLIPSRLRDARKAARLTQGDLGERVGVTRQAISAYERGDKTPEAATFRKLTEALAQPASFFTSEDRPTFGDFSTRFFRKFGPDTVRRNEACAVLGEWFAQIARYFDQHVNYPPVDLPEAAPIDERGSYTGDEFDTIADLCRIRWGLGLGPISNVLALLESKGITVCRYELAGERVEAFSYWNGARPFIFMASEKEASARARFDLAHELGHLILHRWVENEELENPKVLKRIENEADRFAAAFLLPRRSFPNEVYTARLEAFINLKRRWIVSVQAMVYRCRDLGLIDADQFLNLYKQISYRKWRTREPLDDPKILPLEQPRLLRRAVELVTNAGRKHPDEILSDLRLSPYLVEAFCNLPRGMLAGHGPQISFEPTLK